MEMVALTLGSGIEPISTVASQMVLMPLVPFLEFIGVNGYEYVAFFKNKENVRRLFRRIEELQEAKAQMIL
jgi:hypothetical protein